MYLTGFADEAATDIDGQIRATRELGWKHIEARAVNGKNLAFLPEQDFDDACRKLEESGVTVNCFGSAIANWGKQITDPFEQTLDEVSRAISRMKRLGTKLVRIMSYAVLKDRPQDQQMEQERFRRLREIQKLFAGEGLLCVHENCMNYGGMGWKHTLRLIENVPGLKLVFDTGNPVSSDDFTQAPPRPKQSAWEFYQHVKEHIAYVHIKDGVWDSAKGTVTYTFPGEGRGDVARIVRDLLHGGYDGGFSMEPHMAAVFHETGAKPDADRRHAVYVEYGRRFMALLRKIK